MNRPPNKIKRKKRKRLFPVGNLASRMDGTGDNKQPLSQYARELLEAMPDVAFLKSTDGVFLAVNKAWSRFSGFDEASAIGRADIELFDETTVSRFHQQDRIVITSKKALRIEEFFSNGHDPVWYETIKSPVLDEHGNVEAIIGIARDITQRKQMEEGSLRNQRLESIGMLAGGMAHDLNNILGPIMMSASMLREGMPSKTFCELVTTIQEAAQRGADIVSQILSFARGAKGERQVLAPHELIQKVELFLKEILPKSITFTASVPEEIWNITGDITQLHQVVVNLCVNARDAMPNGGTLSITAKNCEVADAMVSKSPDAKLGPHVRISVADSGMGIPEEIMANIFDPFFTTKESGKGTGLGLCMVRGIIKNHGGFIIVESKRGKGSKFCIYLPATTKSPSQAQPVDTSETPCGKGELVLIVDDEISICKMAGAILKKNGYKILSATSGKEALEYFSKHSSSIRTVLTDIAMPVMDGVSLTREIQAISPDTSIIASTGQSSAMRYRDFFKMDINWFLSKPYNAQQLLSIVHKAVNKIAA